MPLNTYHTSAATAANPSPSIGLSSAAAGNNFAVWRQTNSRAETGTLFAKMSEGGVVSMPLSGTFWGVYFGLCTDKFGINWMFSYESAQE